MLADLLPGVATPAGLCADLCVRREDIHFRTSAAGVVEIQVTVTNAGGAPSAPAWLRIESAPLGAFVASQPLVTAPVPSLRPGQSRTLRTRALRPKVQPLGGWDRVPPGKLLTAVGDPDQPHSQPLQLAADIFDLIGRPQTHWAGNLNIFIGDVAVERHLARALRIYPGRTNLAMFVVGSGRDEYAFTLRGEGSAWEAALHEASMGVSLGKLDGHKGIAFGEWVPVRGQGLIILALRPPESATAGTVEVHVTQKSTGRDAVVEFSLDAAAAGPGCYVV